MWGFRYSATVIARIMHELGLRMCQIALAEFVAWAGACVTGDEKGQAHTFLDRLFRAMNTDPPETGCRCWTCPAPTPSGTPARRLTERR